MTAPPFLHLNHVHSIPIMTEYPHTVTVPRTLPTLSSVTVGGTPIRHLKFNRLELFYNLALTTVTSDNWHELNLEMVALMYGMGRHIELKSGLVVSTSSRAGGRTSKLRVADYLTSVFAGQLGSGIAALYARDMGAIYFAHVEDVDNGKVAQLTRQYRRPAPSSGKGKAPRMSTRKGDFLTVNARDEFGILEAKATAGAGPVQTFMNNAVLDGALWQIDPFVPGTIQTMPLTPGAAAPSAIIQHGIVSGLNIHESPAGAAIHAIHFELPTGFPVAGGLSGSVIATPHFQQWWRLFNLTFIDLTLPPRAIDLPVLTLGTASFVTNIQLDPYENGVLGFSHLRQNGWATATDWDNWSVYTPMFLAIEEGVFRQLLAAFTGRRGIREVRGEDGRFRPVEPVDGEATGEPAAVHEAVNRFQAQLSERTGVTQEEDPTGRIQVQAWNAIISEAFGTDSEVVTAFFREGVMAFEGWPPFAALDDQRFRIESE
ncbi:hypothetical protein [Deinococcus soli (ex Cha et al. 2016)]|uniref:hypothetical protein n=1 Tax=Deinococcus soli (ex Cha et al. 2016) TaxID=1309411 RepID=UPI001667C491|nr:hypothetical protein [Deinococcus soli (ex Cha et al. 2016)]GGB73990.1 hypothetical protein GCM10008019_32760 [Deinococcus soli (ex Cha et al. 2016)]